MDEDLAPILPFAHPRGATKSLSPARNELATQIRDGPMGGQWVE